MEQIAEAGQNIDLYAQLSDGIESMPLIVKSKVIDLQGNTVIETTLNHIGGGFFTKSIIMPDLPKIVAQHVVFETDSTTLADEYSNAVQVFARGVIGSGIGNIPSPDQEYVVEVENVEPDLIVELD